MKIRTIYVARIEVNVEEGKIIYRPYAHRTIMHGGEVWESETNKHLVSHNSSMLFDNEEDAQKRADEMFASWTKEDFKKMRIFLKKAYPELFVKNHVT